MDFRAPERSNTYVNILDDNWEFYTIVLKNRNQTQIS